MVSSIGILVNEIDRSVSRKPKIRRIPTKDNIAKIARAWPRVFVCMARLAGALANMTNQPKNKMRLPPKEMAKVE